MRIELEVGEVEWEALNNGTAVITDVVESVLVRLKDSLLESRMSCRHVEFCSAMVAGTNGSPHTGQVHLRVWLDAGEQEQ